MRLSIFKIIAFCALLIPTTGMAMSVPTSETVESGMSFNPVLLGLLSLVLVLVFAIGLLAIVLKQLAFTYSDKMRKERRNQQVVKSIILFILCFLPAVSSFAQDVVNTGEAALEAPVSPFISGIARTDFYFIIGVIFFEVLIILVLLWQILNMVKALRGGPETAHIPKAIFKRNYLDIFNKSVAVEKEASILLDHDYDGIHELDNSLPPWWKYGFMLTILVSIIYLWYYHGGGGGALQIEEYNMAVVKGEEEKAAYLAKTSNNVDENTVTMVLDAGQLAAAEGIFQTTCAACHAKDGGGNVGPNLTDAFWMHGGSIKDVFKTIKYGWPDKGMKSWKDDYSPKQIAALASYVKTLKGSKPLVAKAPQGDLFVEGGDKSIDSISNKTDPTLEPTGKKENKNNPIGPYPVKEKK